MVPPCFAALCEIHCGLYCPLTEASRLGLLVACSSPPLQRVFAGLEAAFQHYRLSGLKRCLRLVSIIALRSFVSGRIADPVQSVSALQPAKPASQPGCIPKLLDGRFWRKHLFLRSKNFYRNPLARKSAGAASRLSLTVAFYQLTDVMNTQVVFGKQTRMIDSDG